MITVEVKENKATYHYDFDREQMVCDHSDVSVVKACCSPYQSGLIECGCGGLDEFVCNNPYCTGLTDDDIDLLVKDKEGEYFDCE